MPYLRNGQEVELLMEKEGVCIVAPIDENGADYYAAYSICKSDMLDEPPKFLYDQEVLELSKKLDDLRDEYRKLCLDYSDIRIKLSSLRTDFASMIINKSDLLEAKTIHYFCKGEIAPRGLSFNNYELNKVKLTFSISLCDMKVKAYGYELNTEGGWSSGKIVDDIGLIIDASQEDLVKIAHSRQDGRTAFDDYYIMGADDIWLNEEFKRVKQNLIQRKLEVERETLRRNLAFYQNRLNSLKE